MSNDPYKTPESSLDEGIQIKTGVFWKIYFVIMTFLLVSGLNSLLAAENSGWAEIVSIIISMPAILGFFCYVFSKRIITREFWSIFFYVYLLFNISYYMLTDIQLSAGMDTKSFLVVQSISWGISLPLYWALYRYGSKSYGLWAGNDG
ncbi:MAG: hypothetical protein MI867_22170 [Pseudomonadales bacterium]|nr:hypothetical protein [Pseudomonadales bacterium]